MEGGWKPVFRMPVPPISVGAMGLGSTGCPGAGGAVLPTGAGSSAAHADVKVGTGSRFRQSLETANRFPQSDSNSAGPVPGCRLHSQVPLIRSGMPMPPRGAIRTLKNLVKWAHMPEWEEFQLGIYDSFLDPAGETLGLGEREMLDIFGREDSKMLMIFIFEEFFATRFGRNREINAVDDYLKRRGCSVTVSGIGISPGLRHDGGNEVTDRAEIGYVE